MGLCIFGFSFVELNDKHLILSRALEMTGVR